MSSREREEVGVPIQPEGQQEEVQDGASAVGTGATDVPHPTAQLLDPLLLNEARRTGSAAFQGNSDEDENHEISAVAAATTTNPTDFHTNTSRVTSGLENNKTKPAATMSFQDLQQLILKLQNRVEELEGQQKQQQIVSMDSSCPSNTSNNITMNTADWSRMPRSSQAGNTNPDTNASRRETSEQRWKDYRTAMKDTFSAEDSSVFMHPELVKRRIPYTQEELEKVKGRPFTTRIFITNVQVEWNTVWLRTLHSDHQAHRSSFIQVRDAFKADAITNNPPAAKYALTELLNMCYGMDESDYYSFACTLASAFSLGAINTHFEKNLLEHEVRQPKLKKLGATILLEYPQLNAAERERKLLDMQQERARTRLLQLMDIVFSKLKQKKMLVDESQYNIYRLVLCMTKYNRGKMPYFYAIFSFFFQTCATAYLILTLTKLDDGEGFAGAGGDLLARNLPMAISTLGYGLMVAAPEVASTKEAFQTLYRSESSISVLAAMDLLVNIISPLAVAFCGFFVVLSGDSFLDGVLNSVALLFISEIDDALPRLLGLDIRDIVQGYLIDQAIEDYEAQENEMVPPVEFNDLLITNNEEGGSIASQGITFQPYEVFGEESLVHKKGNSANGDGNDPPCEAAAAELRHRKCPKGSSRKVPMSRKVRKIAKDKGQQVFNKRSVTADCLLRKVEWQYTSGYDDTCQPRIGHLIMTKLIDNTVVDIVGLHKEEDIEKRPFFSVTGVFMITSFCMSDDILRLRVCGSQTPQQFLRAFDYYSLWPMDSSASDLLKKVRIGHTPKEWRDNEVVLRGPAASPQLAHSYSSRLAHAVSFSQRTRESATMLDESVLNNRDDEMDASVDDEDDTKAFDVIEL
ncbi:expressed unknown protein [Seminavis robusta]|uniref:Uncharacterized protein n=1 Tax=Seminavis robusta TaxID=568900 RepID=A0A9N8E257_9STRA|nr:expressed unknown protein [Seminavis robusta]|eukprot:Sro540_g163010.1 n/a (860) ;mRNA; f:35210-38540